MAAALGLKPASVTFRHLQLELIQSNPRGVHVGPRGSPKVVRVMPDGGERFDQRTPSETRFHMCTWGMSCKLPRSILMTLGL